MSGPSPLPLVVDGVSKTFRIPREHVHTLKERALHPLRRPGNDVIMALRDVSLAVEQGEFFGIVGRNGSGKSTLLKCLAGIYATDRGRIYVNGRVSTFIELGVGFNPDLPAYDNVILNATMLGLSGREARRRYDRVIDFAELHDFTDLKLKNYSSGMMVRLAFSVMIQVDADILLIDEVLAVGDAAFQQKCFDEFARIRASGATVLLVTHDMSSVRRFCDRAMLLEQGEVVEVGEPEHVGNRYYDLNFPRDGVDPAEEVLVGEEEERYGDRGAEVLEAWTEDDHGQRTSHLHAGDRCTVAMRVRFHRDVHGPVFGVSIYTDQRVKLMDADTSDPREARTFAAGEEVEVRITFPTFVTPQRLRFSPGVAYSADGFRWLDRRERLLSVVVSGPQRDGLTALPYEYRIDGVPASTGEQVAT
jgi:ABC-2 type transport system ATP-binding protein